MPKTVLITGSSRGIGLELVTQFSESKNPPKHLFATCRSPEKAEDLKKIARKHANVHLNPLDIASDESILMCLDAVKRVLQPENLGLNLLINNAGTVYHEGSRFSSGLTRKSLMEHMDVNAASPLLVSQAFTPLLRAAVVKDIPMSIHNAAVVNISSDSGSISGDMEVEVVAQQGTGISYRISKAALNMAQKCLSLELKADNILCVSFCPGWVQTEMGRIAEADIGATADLTPQESVCALLTTMDTMGPEHHGKFFHHDGKPIAY